MNTYQKMLNALRNAQKQRTIRQELVASNIPNEKFPELEWVVYERQVMFELVNEERKQNGLEPIQIDDVLKVEIQATGHVDYTTKFALYCAELTLQKAGGGVKS